MIKDIAKIGFVQLCAIAVFSSISGSNGAPRKAVTVTTERTVFLMDGNDKFSGGAGNEIVDGGPGNDTLDGGGGNNTLYYWNKPVAVTITLNGSSWSTARIGNAESDKFKNFQNVVGGTQNDSLTGDLNNNVLEGGPGADQLNGGTGSDTASYAHSKASVKASLLSSSSNTGDAFGDTYVSIENLEGSAFDDTLIGDLGPNIIIGNAGIDVMTGSGGIDTFRFTAISDSKPAAPDMIVDFNPGTSGIPSNYIDLSRIDANSKLVGKQSFVIKSSFSGNPGDLLVYQQGSDVWIDGDTLGNGSANFRIILKNVSASSLLNSNFLL